MTASAGEGGSLPDGLDQPVIMAIKVELDGTLAPDEISWYWAGSEGLDFSTEPTLIEFKGVGPDVNWNTDELLHWSLNGSGSDNLADIPTFYDELRIATTWEDAVRFVTPIPSGWAGPSGDYNDAVNWISAGVPAGHNVILGSSASGNMTAFTDLPISVSNVSISNQVSYVLGSHGPVNLDSNTGGGDTRISVSSGNHQIQAPVSANVNATVNVADTSSLDISDAFSLYGTTLTKTGAGTLSISNINSGGAPSWSKKACLPEMARSAI